MFKNIKDRLREKNIFIGRHKEIELLLQGLSKYGPLVTFIHGIGGIGKSSLLLEFQRILLDREIRPLVLDCKSCEPSEQGLLIELSELIGQHFTALPELTDYMHRSKSEIVLVFDSYEMFNLLDVYIRNEFIPALPDIVRIYIFGKEPPITNWMTAPGWQGLLRVISLQPLNSVDARKLLAHSGVNDVNIQPIIEIAKGHPLALKLATAALMSTSNFTFDALASKNLIHELSQIFLHDIRDSRTRQILEAACVVRRITRSSLKAMLPDIDIIEAYEILNTLPFTEISSDGLIIHESVHQTIENQLKTADPNQYMEYRRLAWRQLKKEMSHMYAPQIWRYTSDMIYLIENDVVRQSFFPADNHYHYIVEQAKPINAEVIRDIAASHDGQICTQYLDKWLEQLPQSFYIVKNRNERMLGFYHLLDPAGVKEALLQQDPQTQLWMQHLKDDPIPPDQSVTFCRRVLQYETSDPLLGATAACLFAITHYNMTRPKLRRFYIVMKDTDPLLAFLSEIGLVHLTALSYVCDNQTFHTYLLDFGPENLFGYIAQMVETSYGEAVPSWSLNKDARALMVDGDYIALSPLEFGVMHFLTANHGRAISRNDLLDEVWGYQYDGGSNVVDAVIRSLRKKLKTYASSIETISGVGYRLK